jgi:hypothetical protein
MENANIVNVYLMNYYKVNLAQVKKQNKPGAGGSHL